MNELNEFKDLVRRMREAQKKFFRMKTSENLYAAKNLERMVDEIISKQNQPLSLFNDD